VLVLEGAGRPLGLSESLQVVALRHYMASTGPVSTWGCLDLPATGPALACDGVHPAVTLEVGILGGAVTRQTINGRRVKHWTLRTSRL